MIKTILVLGGTQMIGRDFLEFLSENKHNYDITICNRGITNSTLFPDIKKIFIDRNNNKQCSKLLNKNFDLIIDFSCYNVKQLSNILQYVKYKHYIILSTLCVSDNNVLLDQTHWLHSYCKNKKDLEEYIFKEKLKNFNVIRPCVLYGKHDYTNRFYEKDNIIYWKHNNLPVEKNKFYIPVRDFTNNLYSFINNQNNLYSTKAVHINGDGMDIQQGIQEYKIHPYESKYLNIKQYDAPFNYIVIDNLFNQNTYNLISKKFPEFIARTIPYKDQPGATSDYEGYISGLGIKDMIDGYDFFASKELQNFVEKSFNIKTSQYISPSAHFHKAPSKDGFIHRDMNICSFPKAMNDNDFVTCGGGVHYTDDTNANPNSVKMIRSVALLYYLNNNDDLSISGGGTGIYDRYNGELIHAIEPKNNRLFIFEISHNSYHAFIGANFDRSAIVSWFHSSPAYIIKRNWKYYKNNKYYLERWTKKQDNEYWAIENDPEYSQYFDRPLKDLLIN
jgi:hypothetical protein